jgi:hypothetical protein
MRKSVRAGHAVATDRGVRFRDLAQLQKAVLARAGAEWRAAAGRKMSAQDKANFLDRDLPPREARAVKVADQLCAALGELAAFVADYQLVPEEQVVVDRTRGDRLYQLVVDRRGRGWPAAETFETRRLWQIVEQYLPDLDPRIHDEHGKAIMVATPSTKHRAARRPAWFAFLEHQSGGWLVSKRGRVAALLKDSSSYWKTFGLRAPAPPRLLACASLLIDGRLPSVPARALATKGVTVAEMIELEEAAIRAHARSRLRRDGQRKGGNSKHR